MKTSGIASIAAAVALASSACLSGCTFASPTTSTYNAGKPLATDAGVDGSADTTSAASGSSDTSSAGSTESSSGTASTTSAGTTGVTATGDDGGTGGGGLCCKQSSGSSAGTCISKDAVPPESQSYVEMDTCTGDNVCVPTSQVNNMPVKCGLADGLLSGVCMGTCFSSYLALASDLLTSDDCGPDDACVPCEALSGRGVAGCDE